MPLYRQEKASAMWGATISRKTIADWVETVAEWLEPLRQKKGRTAWQRSS
ncbi:IS66 family transposase [Cerasicoccus frondis]